MPARGRPCTSAFTPTDTANYTNASKDVTINVLKGTPVITWANPVDITYPTLLSGTQLNATADVGGAFVYTPASGTQLNAGPGQNLHVAFTPTDTANYTNASKDVTIQRAEGHAGDHLGQSGRHHLPDAAERHAAQCHGGCRRRLRLHAGQRHTAQCRGPGRTLHVAFTPTDTANYTNASKGRDHQRAEGHAGHHLGHPADITYPTL
jgi:hypothetical protein